MPLWVGSGRSPAANLQGSGVLGHGDAHVAVGGATCPARCRCMGVELEARMAAISRILEEMRPDVVLLQEVGAPGGLCSCGSVHPCLWTHGLASLLPACLPQPPRVPCPWHGTPAARPCPLPPCLGRSACPPAAGHTGDLPLAQLRDLPRHPKLPVPDASTEGQCRAVACERGGLEESRTTVGVVHSLLATDMGLAGLRLGGSGFAALHDWHCGLASAGLAVVPRLPACARFGRMPAPALLVREACLRRSVAWPLCWLGCTPGRLLPCGNGMACYRAEGPMEYIVVDLGGTKMALGTVHLDHSEEKEKYEVLGHSLKFLDRLNKRNTILGGEWVARPTSPCSAAARAPGGPWRHSTAVCLLASRGTCTHNAGDFNWRSEAGGKERPMRLREGWKDAWASLRPGHLGYTFDEELVRGSMPARRPPAARLDLQLRCACRVFVPGWLYGHAGAPEAQERARPTGISGP